MIVRKEGGCLIITDVYEPPVVAPANRSPRTPMTLFVFAILFALAAIGMGLAAWNEGWAI